MWQSKPVLVLLLLAVSTAASDGKPLLTKVTKGGASTALYTAPLSAGRPLVLDLSAPTITTPCSGQTTTVTLSANSTDDSNPLAPVSFAATATCAAAPSGAVGVAGLARSSASFPAQVASTQNVPNSFALCLPSDGRTGFSGNGVGAAIFGGGPFFLAPPADRPSITTLLSEGVPLRQPFAGNPGYFVTASNGIAVGGTRVTVSGSGALVVGLSSTTLYTQLRSDVYRPFITAFDRAMGSSAKVAAVAPFELCYAKLSQDLSGYLVPNVDLMLEGGTNWTVVGGNSMAQVNSGTACFAFVRAGSTGAVPAVVIGGFQMENKLVVVDNVKQTLSFTPYLPAREFSCSNFNFTRAA